MNGALYSVTTPSVINKWYHIVYTRKGSILNIYRDNVLEKSQACSSSIINITGYLLLGLDQDAVGGGFDSTQSLSGLLQDMRIYNRSLSTEEIDVLYCMGKESRDTAKFTKNNIYINGEIREV